MVSFPILPGRGRRTFTAGPARRLVSLPKQLRPSAIRLRRRRIAVGDTGSDGGGYEVIYSTDLDAYLTSLEDLAASDTPAQARAKADALVAAFGTADADRPAAFERLGARVRDRQDLIATSAEFFVNQVRVAALRRVMAKADAVIEDAVPLVASHLAAFDEPLLTAQENLLRADGAVLDAIEAGDQTAHATAIANLRSAHTAFQKAEAASPITQLYLFRAAHARLLARTRIGADPGEFVDALEELRALRDAAVES